MGAPKAGSDGKKVAVLYGSQTGNAQSIAEALAEDAKSKGYSVTLAPLNKWKTLEPSLEGGDATAVVICSTTGQLYCL